MIINQLAKRCERCVKVHKNSIKFYAKRIGVSVITLVLVILIAYQLRNSFIQFGPAWFSYWKNTSV